MTTQALGNVLPWIITGVLLLFSLAYLRPKRTPGLGGLERFGTILFALLCLGVLLIVAAHALPYGPRIRAVGALLAGLWFGFNLCHIAVAQMIRRGRLTAPGDSSVD